MSTFSDCQRRYDNMTPPDEPDIDSIPDEFKYVECPECGELIYGGDDIPERCPNEPYFDQPNCGASLEAEEIQADPLAKGVAAVHVAPGSQRAPRRSLAPA